MKSMDNNDYYQIDDKWHTVMFGLFTRHSKIFGKTINTADVETGKRLILILPFGHTNTILFTEFQVN